MTDRIYTMDKQVTLLELALDQGRASEACLKTWPEAPALVLAFETAEWSWIQRFATELFEQNEQIEIRALAIQIGVMAAEIQYDLNVRQCWLKKWDLVPHWASCPYSLYLKTFQDGLTAFFNSSLKDAEIRFDRALEISTHFNYARGMWRSHFHLGLVARDQEMSDRSLGHFTAALHLAKKGKADKFVKRVEIQIKRLMGETSPINLVQNSGPFSENLPLEFGAMRAKLETLILTRQFQLARITLLEMEIERRKRKLNRESEGLSLYHNLIIFGLKRRASNDHFSLSRIRDPLLKVKYLRFKSDLFGISSIEINELRESEMIYGVSKIDHEVCGILLSHIKCQQIKGLMELLLSTREPVSKEQICTRLWGFNYDPVIHDRRVYKLIQKSKALFNSPDLFSNTYGAYQINKRLLGGNSFTPKSTKSA